MIDSNNVSCFWPRPDLSKPFKTFQIGAPKLKKRTALFAKLIDEVEGGGDWSPDGRQVAFMRPQANHDALCVYGDLVGEFFNPRKICYGSLKINLEDSKTNW